MQCDIIIPTYQNVEVLPQTLNVLAAQAIPSGWSVRTIISDDGSTDQTVTVAKRALQSSHRLHHIITGPHTGAAGARNRAIEQASGDIIFFLGADILLRPGALATHLQFHTQHHESAHAALGFIVWDPALPPSPLMEWLTHGGPQNDFDALLGQRTADPAHFFYASHLSLKRSFLLDQRFSTDFGSYGWEDLDLGRRLKKNGLILHILHHALGLHHHAYSPAALLKRQYNAGHNLIVYQKRHPAVALLPTRSRLHQHKVQLAIISGVLPVVRWVLQLLPKASVPPLFSLFAATAFWKGAYNKNK